MNRKILFRGYEPDDKKWITGAYSDGGCKDGDWYRKLYVWDAKHARNTVYYVEADSVGQYSGLNDKNGVEIYEGDIVEITSYFTHPRDKVFARIKAEVVFRDGAFVAIHGSGAYHIANFLEDVEVIGNTHDTPELLKGGNNGL